MLVRMLRHALAILPLALTLAAQDSRPARDLRTLAGKAARAQKTLLVRFEPGKARLETAFDAALAEAAKLRTKDAKDASGDPGALEPAAAVAELDRTIAGDAELARKFAAAFQVETWSLDDPEGAALHKSLKSPFRGTWPGLALIDRTGEPMANIDAATWRTAGKWDPARISEFVDYWSQPLPKSDRFAQLKQRYGLLYDPKADAMADVDAAIARAKAEGKHVLVKVGFNNCPWCYFLHDELETRPDLGKLVESSYVLVRVSCDGDNRNEALMTRLDRPGRFGYPVLDVLDGDGKRLHTQDSGLLEIGDHHDPRRVTAFLRGWTPAALQGRR